MEFLKNTIKLVCYLSISFLSNSCDDSSSELDPATEYKIDSKLVKYVDAFFVEAKLHGIDLVKENLIVNATNSDQSTNVCGLCKQYLEAPNKQRTIEIKTDNSTCWEILSENDREALVFHELAHCLLKRIDHKNDLFKDGSPKSIMHASIRQFYSNCVYPIGDNCNKSSRREYYINEVFDQNTATPTWAK